MKGIGKCGAFFKKSSALKKTVREQKTLIFQLNDIIQHLPGSIYWKDRKEFIWVIIFMLQRK